MSTVKRFTVLPNVREPIEFEMADPSTDPPTVLGLFHMTRRPRLDIALAMGQAVTLNNGTREIDKTMVLWVIREMLIEERRNEAGEWEPADDRARFDELLGSDRYEVDYGLLGNLIMWLTEELTEHPTGASSP